MDLTRIIVSREKCSLPAEQICEAWLRTGGHKTIATIGKEHIESSPEGDIILHFAKKVLEPEDGILPFEEWSQEDLSVLLLQTPWTPPYTPREDMHDVRLIARRKDDADYWSVWVAESDRLQKEYPTMAESIRWEQSREFANHAFQKGTLRFVGWDGVERTEQFARGYMQERISIMCYGNLAM